MAKVTLTAAQLAELTGKSFTAGATGGAGVVSGLVPLGAPVKVSKPSVNYRKADDPARSCGDCYMFVNGDTCTSVAGRIKPADVCDLWTPRDAAKGAKPDGPYVAGLMVRAADTGRVLMLQRAIDDGPAAGKFEPPGGHAEPGEPLPIAAGREWQEEVGHPLPRGTITGSWTSGDGVYRGYVLTVPSEDVIDLEHGRDQIANPDGDTFEAAAWMDPATEFAGNPSLRPEMVRDLDVVMGALNGVTKSARGQTSAEILREYWRGEAHPGPTQFALERKIRWGEPDDWYRCHDELTPYLGAEGAKGYCNLRHHEVLGYWPAQHARMEREGK